VPILSKLHLVQSGDGEKRARLKWGNHRKFVYFATLDEIRELVRDLLLLLKDAENFDFERKEDEP
jgi:hypothetical protein